MGTGRRWPLLLVPAYRLMEAIPATRESARRLGLVTLEEMVRTMARAVEKPSDGIRVLEVPQIRGAEM